MSKKTAYFSLFWAFTTAISCEERVNLDFSISTEQLPTISHPFSSTGEEDIESLNLPKSTTTFSIASPAERSMAMIDSQMAEEEIQDSPAGHSRGIQQDDDIASNEDEKEPGLEIRPEGSPSEPPYNEQGSKNPPYHYHPDPDDDDDTDDNDTDYDNEDSSY